jgi:dipeptidyl aminopeptidase/acylaminoacyl peptidase
MDGAHVDRKMRLRTELIALGVSLCVVSAAPPADAAFPGANGRLAFRSDRPPYGLTTARFDGSDRRVLGEQYREPTWSADGRRLALTANIYHLATVNPDGSDARTLLPREHDTTYRASWSPGGTRIAYDLEGVSQEDWDDGHIWTIGSAGTDARRLTYGFDDGSPAWSPDGCWIAFVRSQAVPGLAGPQPDQQIYVMRPDGSDLRRLTPGEPEGGLYLAPEWSPDGKHVAMIGRSESGTGVMVMRADGTEIRTVAPVDGSAPSNVAWSPDAQWLVYPDFVLGPDSKTTYLFAVHPDGTLRHQLEWSAGAWQVDWGPEPGSAPVPTPCADHSGSARGDSGTANLPSREAGYVGENHRVVSRRLSSARTRGVHVRVACEADCVVDFRLVVASAVARRMGFTPRAAMTVVGRRRVSVRAGALRRTFIRLYRSARRYARHHSQLRVGLQTTVRGLGNVTLAARDLRWFTLR